MPPAAAPQLSSSVRRPRKSRGRRVRSLWLLLAASCVGCRAPARPPALDATRPTCYAADRPLGLSYGGSWEGTSPDLARFQLWPGGTVRRAGLRSGDPLGWRGSWQRTGDTLQVRVGTCCSSWMLALVPEQAGDGRRTYTGVATYGSDAVVVGRPAPRTAIRVGAVPCPDGPPPNEAPEPTGAHGGMMGDAARHHTPSASRSRPASAPAAALER